MKTATDFISDALTISKPLDASGQREIRLGAAVAYGEVAEDGHTYALIHSPRQDWFDSIASILDAAEPDQLVNAMKKVGV